MDGKGCEGKWTNVCVFLQRGSFLCTLTLKLNGGQAFNSSTAEASGGRGWKISEFKAILVYTASS